MGKIKPFRYFKTPDGKRHKFYKARGVLISKHEVNQTKNQFKNTKKMHEDWGGSFHYRIVKEKSKKWDQDVYKIYMYSSNKDYASGMKRTAESLAKQGKL